MVFQKFNDTMNANSSSAEQNKKIFLGGLNHQTTDDTLRSFCSKFGKMTDCLVMRTSDGKSRGFGFVTYEDISSVEDLMHSRPHTIDNRQVETKRAMPREAQKSTEAHLTVKKLFITGLRDDIDESILQQYFSRFGNITEILVMKDHDGKPRGFAFISFDDYDAIDKIILEKPHSINGRNIDVKKAVPKDKMQEKPPLNRNNFNNNSWNNQQGYNYNPSMSSNTNRFQPSFNSFELNQRPPQSLMNYNQNQQQGFNPNNFGRMNNPSNFNNGPPSFMPFDNLNSFGMSSQNYPANHTQGRGGPIRAGRGRGSGPAGNYNRPGPYSSRGGRGRGSNYSSRGRGRGQ